MDKIKKYQDILVEYLEDYAKTVKPKNLPDVDAYVIADRKNNHFQFLRIGWQGQYHVFSAILHFDIKNGKVWVQQNNTERDVVDVFMEKGIPKEDIVMGFHPPNVRKYTEFAEG